MRLIPRRWPLRSRSAPSYSAESSARNVTAPGREATWAERRSIGRSTRTTPAVSRLPHPTLRGLRGFRRGCSHRPGHRLLHRELQAIELQLVHPSEANLTLYDELISFAL